MSKALNSSHLWKLFRLHGLQRLPLCPLNIRQIVLMVLGPGDHGLGEGGDAGYLPQLEDDLDGLAARRHVAEADAAHHHADAGLDKVGGQPAGIVYLSQGLDKNK
jgi:hypothetical protein